LVIELLDLLTCSPALAGEWLGGRAGSRGRLEVRSPFHPRSKHRLLIPVVSAFHDLGPSREMMSQHPQLTADSSSRRRFSRNRRKSVRFLH